MAGARQIVDPPSFTPVPFGLLTTVEWPAIEGPHWQNGISYSPMCSPTVSGIGSLTYSQCLAVTGAGGSPPAPPNLSNNVQRVLRGATPCVAYVEFDCAPVGNEQAQAAAEQALAMAASSQVELAFWTGLAAGQNVVFPHLAANAQVLDPSGILLQTVAINVTGSNVIGVSGDLLNIETALGLLEGALANCYGGVGVIHVPEMLLPTMDAWGIVRSVGSVMKTLNGNKVAVGSGYPGTGPDGTSRVGNSCWMYATGNVFGFQSEVRVRAPQGPQAFDRSTNTMRMIAERTYVLGWDCCHFAVQASLGVPKGT
jgi:hypothetical protein